VNYFLHEHPDFANLVLRVAQERGIDPFLVEKDYWIMHALWGLGDLGFEFELKGGTSLSKGHRIIERFSEDLDIRIEPSQSGCGFQVYDGPNHEKSKHVASRKKYFDWVRSQLQGKISGVVDVERDVEFDDGKYRSGGIRLHYESRHSVMTGIKDGILLELGFAITTPKVPITISSWAWDEASKFVTLFDNRAVDVDCYDFRYTFVEKLQTIVTKYRNFKETKRQPKNFLRHYYDVFQLLEKTEVHAFIGTDEYNRVKNARFSQADRNTPITAPFELSSDDLKLFEAEYERTRSLYYNGQPPLRDILDRIQEHLPFL
jgi:predicted nucleotidyltransferase component of viral defense system